MDDTMNKHDLPVGAQCLLCDAPDIECDEVTNIECDCCGESAGWVCQQCDVMMTRLAGIDPERFLFLGLAAVVPVRY